MIVEVVPAVIPVTIPDDAPIVAWPVTLLLHTPPPVLSVSAEGVPTQTLVLPLIAPGAAFTLRFANTEHPDVPV